MRSIVHIGYYKCGSTALQASLVAGARDLLQVGCLVPMSGRVANGSHGELAFSLLQEHEQRIPEWYLRSIPGEPPSFESVAGDFADEVAREQPETILVSSEELVRLGSIESSEQAVERFAGCLPDGEAQILVYIRRPDHYIVAWYGQLIRIGASVPPLKRGIRRWVKTIHVDFKRALQPWVDHFGSDRIVLRDYNALVGGDVLADFADATGFELPAPRSEGG